MLWTLQSISSPFKLYAFPSVAVSVLTVLVPKESVWLSWDALGISTSA